jgi:imidazolonepropionase-like amidohydrolase
LPEPTLVEIQPMPVLFEGGQVFDGTGRALAGHAVLVEGDTIAALAPAAEFSGYAGPRIDTSDGTVLPGLIDCHVHLVYGGEPDPGTAQGKLSDGQITIRALEHAQAALAGGITGLRDCGGKDYLEFAVRDAVNAGRHLGPTIRAVGRMICMTGGHGNRVGRVADGVEDVIRAVREQIHAGADQIKIMATGGVMTPGVNPEDAHYTAEEIGAGIAEGKRFNKKSASHAQGSEGILNAVRGGITSIEHGIFMTDECIKEMLAAGTYLVPTLAAVANITGHADKGVPDYVIEKAMRVLDIHKQSVRRFYKAGGLIAMGTDAGTPFNMHGANALELSYMTDIGISSTDAMVISTRNAADLLSLEDRGTIAVGKKADLLVVDGDPVQDITKVAQAANHRMVMKNGIIAKDRDAESNTIAGAPPIGRFATAASAGF